MGLLSKVIMKNSHREKSRIILTQLANRIKRYSEALPWFIGDIFSKFLVRFIAISAASFIGSAGYVGAFGIGYLYIKSVQTGQFPKYLPFDISSHSQELILFLVTIFIASFLISAALLEFWSRRQVNLIAWKYGDICAKRVIAKLSENNLSSFLYAQKKPTKRDFLGLAYQDARMCGISARLLAIGLVNIAALPLLFVVLLVVSFKLTMLVVIIFLLAVTFYYRFSIKAVGFRKSLEKNAVLSKNERLNLIERSMYGFGNILIDDRQFDTPFKDGASYKFGEAFAGQRNMLEASTFLSKVMIALLLGLVLNVAFFEIKNGNFDWGQLLVYVGVLQLFALKLVGAARVVVSVNRFYPTISRYWTFIKGTTQKHLELGEPRELKIKTKKGMIRLDNSVPYGLLLNSPVGKHDVSYLVPFVFVSSGKNDECLFDLRVKIVNPIPAGTLATPAEYFDLRNSRIKEVRDVLETLYGGKYLRRSLDVYFDADRRTDSLRGLTAEEIIIFSLISAELSSIDMLIINLELLEQAADEFIDYLNANTPKLKFLLVLSYSNFNKKISTLIESTIVFLSEREVAVFDNEQVKDIEPIRFQHDQSSAIPGLDELEDEY